MNGLGARENRPQHLPIAAGGRGLQSGVSLLGAGLPDARHGRLTQSLDAIRTRPLADRLGRLVRELDQDSGAHAQLDRLGDRLAELFLAPLDGLLGGIEPLQGSRYRIETRIVRSLGRHGDMVPQGNRLVRAAYRPGVSRTPLQSPSWPPRKRRAAIGHETYFTGQSRCGKLASRQPKSIGAVFIEGGGIRVSALDYPPGTRIVVVDDVVGGREFVGMEGTVLPDAMPADVFTQLDDGGAPFYFAECEVRPIEDANDDLDEQARTAVAR